jgi:hypothetical protein
MWLPTRELQYCYLHPYCCFKRVKLQPAVVLMSMFELRKYLHTIEVPYLSLKNFFLIRRKCDSCRRKISSKDWLYFHEEIVFDRITMTSKFQVPTPSETPPGCLIFQKKMSLDKPSQAHTSFTSLSRR